MTSLIRSANETAREGAAGDLAGTGRSTSKSAKH